MSRPLVSIVTACDRHFLWGAFLLASSAAKNIPHVPLHVLQTGFSADDRALLEQFPQVQLHQMEEGNRRNVCNRKAEAILLGSGEYIGWLDADCLIIGDVAAGLVPENTEFQIRLRDRTENAWVWRDHYEPGETRGGLPRTVLAQWRQDVGQLETPRIDSACVTNAFVLHRRHLDFIAAWGEQIARVIPASDGGVVNKSSPAYFMTDESVLTSLLAFSRLAPPIGEWRLNRDPEHHVAHFGANPKPWKRWRPQSWYCHAHVMALLEWVRASGYRHPELPWSLRAHNRLPAKVLAKATEAWSQTRALGGKILRQTSLSRR